MSNNHPRVGDRYRATEHIRALGFGLPGDGLCVGDIVRITEDHGVRVSIERESPGVATIRNGAGFHFTHFADSGSGRAFELVERAAPKHDLKPGDMLVLTDHALTGEPEGLLMRFVGDADGMAGDGGPSILLDYPGTERKQDVWALSYYTGKAEDRAIRRATEDEAKAASIVPRGFGGLNYIGREQFVVIERTGHGLVLKSSEEPHGVTVGRLFRMDPDNHVHTGGATQAETTAPEPDCAKNERFALSGDQPEDMAKWAAKAPDGATHVAIDYSGEVWAYYAKPVAIESQKLWAYARENQYGGSGTQAKTAQLLGNVARGFQGWQYTLYETGAARLVPAGESRKEALDTISDAYVQALEARVEEQKATIALLEGVNAAQAASISALRADAKRDAKLTAERYDRLRELLGIPMGLPVEQAVQNMLAQNHSLIEQLRQRTAERDAAHQTLLSRKVIELSRAEVQFGLDRVRWAAGLIRQLPVTHDGRNSWLMHYGNEAERARCFTAALTKPEADADEMAGMPVAQPTEAQVEAKRALEAVERPMYRTIKLNGRPVRVVAPIWF